MASDLSKGAEALGEMGALVASTLTNAETAGIAEWA